MKWSNEDKKKQKNLKGLLSNPSTRPVVFLTGGLVLGMIGLGYLNMGKTSDQAVESSASVSSPVSAKHVPGTSNSSIHDELQRQENERALLEARKRGSSSIPVLTGNANAVNEPLTLPVDRAQSEKDKNMLIIQQPTVAQAPPPVEYAPVVYNMPPPSEQVAVPMVKGEVSNDMNQQIAGYLAMWGPSNNNLQEFKYAGQELKEQNFQGQQNGQYSGDQIAQYGSGQNMAPRSDSSSKIRYVRAGSYVPAKLIIPVNSDEPGPVMAEITSGPLQGARLIGSASMGKEAMTITFRQISKPGWPDVYGVDAIAMNDSLSTAMATDVDKHRFQRYLGLFGGSYMESYGEGMQQSQGSSTIYNPIGGVTQIRDPLNSEQIRNKAQGGVATEVGREWQRNSNRKVTVKVQGDNGAPLPINILFLSNF